MTQADKNFIETCKEIIKMDILQKVHMCVQDGKMEQKQIINQL